MKPPQRFEILVFGLFFVSGITGLIYEVAWTRMFIDVFGSTTYAVSTVLAAFMAGLALGGLVLGRKGDGLSRPVLVYGVLELAIGAYAFLMPKITTSLLGVYADVFQAFGQQPLPVAIVRFALSFGVILVPTTLMGGTLPILSKFAGREFPSLGRNVGGLYATNTFGAVIGSFATGFFLLEMIGVSSSVYLAAAASVLVGATATMAGRGTAAGAAQETVSKPTGRDALPGYVFVVTLLAIGVSGGAALAYEVIYTKVLVFSLGATAHAFSLMLTTFLVGIAIGSFVASRLVDRSRRPIVAFGVVEILIGLAALVSISLLSRLDFTHDYLDLRDAGGNLFRLRGAGFLQAASIMLVPTLLMGSAFPIAARICARRRTVSSSVGEIYFANTVGAVIGSLAAGFVLVPALGSARSIAFAAAFNVGAGLLLFSGAWRKKIWIPAAAAGLVGLLIVAYQVSPSVMARTFNIKEEGSQLLYFHEGASGTVTVHRYPQYDLLAIDGVNVAGTSNMLRVTQKLQGHLPILLADDKARVAHIGFGSGETLRILTLHNAGRIDGIEICKDVIYAARRFFSSINKLVFDRPNVNVIIMDGKNYIRLTREEYDIIMTDSIYPGTGGASALYTYDHFKAVRDRLRPGGIASCWLPLDLHNTDLKVALKAFYDVFPNMSVWYCYMTFSQHALLVGKKDAEITIDLNRFAEAFRDSVIREDLKTILIDDPFTLMSCYLADGEAVRAFCGDAPRNSDDHPVLEFGSARRGSAKPFLATNLEGLLALRPNPLGRVTAIGEAGFDSATVAREVMKKFILSSNIIGGHIHNALGEFGTARAQYEKVLALEPDNPIAVQSLEMLDQTLGTLERAARRGGNDYEANYTLGVRYLAEGQFDQALEYLEKALAVRSDIADPYVSIGEAYMRSGQVEKALPYLVDAERIKPDDAGILLRLGMVYDRVGRKDEAKEAFERSLKINPESYELRTSLGALYLSQGDITNARKQFEEAYRMAPQRPHALYDLGLTSEAARDWNAAAEYYRQVIRLAPAFFPAHYHLGEVLIEMGDRDGAIQEWERTLQIKPDHENARKRLSQYRP